MRYDYIQCLCVKFWLMAAMDCRGQGGSSEDSGGVKGNTLCGHIIRGLANYEKTIECVERV